jgi:RNA polymerase sigma factor (TIGR02999 family)
MKSISSNQPVKSEHLLPIVYDQLKRIASQKLRGENSPQTLQTTALVHEAFLKLSNTRGRPIEWADEEHFLRAAAKAMQRILVDHARSRNRLKRGGGNRQVPLDGNEVDWKAFDLPEFLPELDDALERLQQIEPTAAELVQLRFFGGLSVTQAASAIGISPRSADRMWVFARAWLFRELSDPATP